MQDNLSIFTCKPSEYPYPIVDVSSINFPLTCGENEKILWLGTRCTKISLDGTIISYNENYVPIEEHSSEMTPELFYSIYMAHVLAIIQSFEEPFKTPDYLTPIFYEPKKLFDRITAVSDYEVKDLREMMAWDDFSITTTLPDNIEEFYKNTVNKKAFYNISVTKTVYGMLDEAFNKAKIIDKL